MKKFVLQKCVADDARDFIGIEDIADKSKYMFDISKTRNMDYMFLGAKNIVKMPELDTQKIISMNNMFYDCNELQEIPLYDTHNVKLMQAMFYKCNSLKEIPKIDTSNVINTFAMFGFCSNLTKIPELNTMKVKDMRKMFFYCTSLPEKFPWTINCFNVSDFAYMGYMFKGSSVKQVTFSNMRLNVWENFDIKDISDDLVEVTINNFI